MYTGPPRHAHSLKEYQWCYYEDLASLGQFAKGWCKTTKEITEDADQIMESDFRTLRSYRYRIIDRSNWDKIKE